MCDSGGSDSSSSSSSDSYSSSSSNRDWLDTSDSYVDHLLNKQRSSFSRRDFKKRQLDSIAKTDKNNYAMSWVDWGMIVVFSIGLIWAASILLPL